MWWADRAIARGDVRRLRIGLAVAFVLAAAFLGIQVFEYASSEFSWSTNAYGSLFFTVTGFHGLHVLLALLLNAALQVRAAFGDFDERRHGAVETVALYWHFVDVVWILIFLSLYVGPYVH
jgi:heme/copper-type cytochrome/quinol oxidase subunit 3